jgi:hypothetical protein
MPSKPCAIESDIKTTTFMPNTSPKTLPERFVDLNIVISIITRQNTAPHISSETSARTNKLSSPVFPSYLHHVARKNTLL